MNELILLIPVLPWFGALFLALSWLFFANRAERGEKFTARVAMLSVVASSILIIVIDVLSLLQHHLPGYLYYGNWFTVGDIAFPISIELDLLALVLINLVSWLLLLTLRFSILYLHREQGFQRFFIIYLLFAGAMLLLIMAGSAVLTFVGWELVGLCSYLLIGYAITRDVATRNATRVFIINRIGDSGFLLAMFIAFGFLASVEWPAINHHSATIPDLVIASMAMGFVLAAIIKAAQFPFSSWMPQALEGPTPSSAIFYGAMVNLAGVYLLLRLQPLLESVPTIMIMLVIIGAITAVYGYLSGLVQADIKSGLIFSTISQVGLIFVLLGLGLFWVATIYLLLHTIWRTYQFLHAPSIMQWTISAAKPIPAFIKKNHTLYNLALERFALDAVSDKLVSHPILALSRDLSYFDDRLVARLVGLPSSASTVSLLDNWDTFSADQKVALDFKFHKTGDASGLAGQAMELTARPLHWIEEHLVLHGGEKGLHTFIHRLGTHLNKIELLLSQPRYLWLLIFTSLFIAI